MAIQFRMLFAGALAFSIASPGFASEPHGQTTGSGTPSTNVSVLVRVHKLTGLNAGNREQVLYASEKGMLIPLSSLAQGIAARLDAPQHVPDGAYHHLKIELANDIQIFGQENAPVHSQIKPDGGPTMLKMSGTVVFINGEVRPLALAVDTGRLPGDYAMLAERGSAYGPRDKRENGENDVENHGDD